MAASIQDAIGRSRQVRAADLLQPVSQSLVLEVLLPLSFRYLAGEVTGQQQLELGLQLLVVVCHGQPSPM